MTCVWFELLSRIPFTGLRLRWCRRHADGCPRCRQASESGEMPPPLLITADQVHAGLDLWPGVRQRIGAPAIVPLPARRPWRWGYAAATLALLLLAGFWIRVVDRRSAPLAPSAPLPTPQIRLCSAKIADRPARVFQVQSRDPNRSIFWIARNNPRS